ncbi:PREDICTED: intercellular adhesion molecule 1 [Ceratotherium simum simum]|uniref:Intercellular adhesion molecule 1 n=1 Tax=Ceratotherium simum simum TaxID=73337 RepID=A0ABM0I8L5_CERSS|nr:PREDICTED: intercellular adhesion molecule 1 [Ceratotherium simum simum]
MAPGAARCAPALPALLALLGALLPGLGEAQVSVHPREAIIPRGGSVEVNCSAPCSNVGLETNLNKTEVASGHNWKTFRLSNVQEDSSPICFANCHNQTSDSMNLTVYGTPSLVELAPLPRWQPVGENLTLSCQVVGGAPRASLTVVLLRGEEELSRQPAVGKATQVNATVLARREDHGANFSCRTELDLRPQGLGLFQNSSAPRQLRTFVLPETNPRLSDLRVAEVEREQLVECTMDGLFPASEAEVHLGLGDRRLQPTVTYKGDSFSATALVKAHAEEQGPQKLVCEVMLGDQTRTTREKVTFYSFPAPNLTLSQPEVSEGTVVTVECEAHAGAVVTLSGAAAGKPASRARVLLNASSEDDERVFSCSADLEVAGQVLRKTRTRQLRVLYGPKLDKKDCLGNWTWQEGSTQTLRCKASGNPTPELNCPRKWDGAQLPIGDLKPVKREIAGTYKCQAKSSQGEVTRDVVVIVIYHENKLAIIILVTVAGVLGTLGTAAYLYNRQRKIQKYRLQKAAEAAALKLNTPATPP